MLYAHLLFGNSLIEVHSSTLANKILDAYCNSAFAGDEHNDLALNLSQRMLINIFSNNKQEIVNELIRKDSLSGFKKRQ